MKNAQELGLVGEKDDCAMEFDLSDFFDISDISDIKAPTFSLSGLLAKPS